MLFELELDVLYFEVVMFVWFVDFFLFDRFRIRIVEVGGVLGCKKVIWVFKLYVYNKYLVLEIKLCFWKVKYLFGVLGFG